MKRKLQGLLGLLFIVGLFAGFQYWAVKSRERDWWWFNGGPDHMAFADLRSASDSKGHILIVERIVENAPQTEFNVTWKCNPRRISWGEAWTRDGDFNQLDRSPAPKTQALAHAPSNPMENEFLGLACASGHRAPRTLRLSAQTSPLKFASYTFVLVAQGVPPPQALQQVASKQSQ